MAKPYIVVAHHSDGIRVTEHNSKKEAHEHGKSLRKQGVTAYAHSKEHAEKYGLDPRKSGLGAWTDANHPRDDKGRFSGK